MDVHKCGPPEQSGMMIPMSSNETSTLSLNEEGSAIAPEAMETGEAKTGSRTGNIRTMKNNEIKKIKGCIEEFLSSDTFQDAAKYIDQYADLCPWDFDLVTYRCIYSLYIGTFDEALKWGIKAIKQYPTSGDAYYNLGCVYQNLDDLYNAIICFERSCVIYASDGNADKINQLKIDERLVLLYNDLEQRIVKTNNPVLIERAQMLAELKETLFGLADLTYRSFKPAVGKYVFGANDRKLYSCMYRFQNTESYDENSFNPHQCKLEIMPVIESRNITLGEEDHNYLVPIASKNKNTLHKFNGGNACYNILQRSKHHFNYYLIDGRYSIHSSGTAYYGRPIELGNDPGRKRLILNIFVDGLSQTVLDKMNELMPNTYNFFADGIICRRAYSTAEWTYPSLASFNSGLYTPGHMMFHNTLDIKLPENITTLAEYFERAGYFTAKMDGDWRSTPNYGYDRGYRQIIYQSQINASKCETIIGEAIDHLEAFNETDQFLWLCMGDLHDVADEYDLTLAAQTHIPLGMRTPDNIGLTSVKQSYSLKKKCAYERLVRHIDVLLNLLYQYVNQNYAQGDVVVSLFADHGQGFLVDDNEHFMSDGRTKVAFMFKGNTMFKGISDEIMSTCDYIPIVCKLAGIPLSSTEKIDGHLPMIFGGDEPRDYTISESIHPGDPYQAVIHTADYCFYYTTGSIVGNDGRFEFDEFDVYTTDHDGNRVNNSDIINRFTKILLNHIEPLTIH